jgi:hypothetical protein
MMRYTYWWIEALIGALLIVAPFAEKFAQVKGPTYTDVIAGILLVVWALVGYYFLGEMPYQEVRHIRP